MAGPRHQPIPVSLVILLTLALVLTGVVAVAASRTAAESLDEWPSQMQGDEALAGLLAPPYENPSRVVPASSTEIIETEWPVGSGQFYQHPTVAARYIHGLYAAWLAGELTAAGAESMRVHADFLADTIDRRSAAGEEFGSWLLPMPNVGFNVGPGWTSAFTNGAGALALEQAARVFPEKASAYHDVASLAVASFDVTVANGGVTTEHDQGTCLEEVAHPAAPTCVLNGHVFAMGYLYSLARGSSLDTRQILADGDLYLGTHLDDYSTPFASRYSPDGKYAEPDGYNHIHGAQMLWLYVVTGNRDYYETAALWSQFDGAGSSSTIVASKTVDTAAHGEELLVDGPAWFGYWSATGAVTLKSDLLEPAPVCGFNIFYVEGSEPASVTAAVGAGPSLKVEVVDQDLDGDPGYETRPTAYRFERCVAGDTLRVDLTARKGNIVGVRELDVIMASDVIANERLRRMFIGQPITYGESITLRSVGVYR